MKDLGEEHSMIIIWELIPSPAFGVLCSICTFFGGHWPAFPGVKHSYKKKQVVLDFLVTPGTFSVQHHP